MSLRQHEVFRGVYTVQVCAFDRTQAVELLRNDFKCDPDIDKVRVTRVISKPLGNGECLYTLFFRLDGHKPKSKYKCPECHSDDIKSWSPLRLRCNNCGRTFPKKPRRKNGK